ncbi:uncharacterized protein LOC116197639 [Punica granatum]|uniref:Uncharacterized protein LOC116197639 n=1 Tax=Punica granatum TaxID=22663 RepID=A0A218X716_PUNGR|nr:uncharacterized protein LOC116197639 [Punica granatum]OWM80476.1 hypothetical protein CDL15_Pgr019756 [Punica granatum]
MASSSSSYAFRHARSNSLPSRAHPVISKLDETLSSLRTSETTCSSSSSVTCKVNDLQDLHGCVDQLLLLPLVQQAFTQECHSRWADELLDGSLRLLDLCSTAKNSLLRSKEALQELQSSMCRRKAGESMLDIEIQKYLSVRKSVRKAMKKATSSLKARKDDSASSALIKEDEAAAFVTLLKEIKVATTAVFESVFCLLSGARQPRSSIAWSFISKVTLKRRAASTEVDLNGFAKQDMALESLIRHKTGKVHDLTQVQQLQDGLKNLDLDIHDLEEGLESLHRRLIKSRVSLLNIINH